ncbi:hypothetical protein V8F06_003804 [Rhypophila decipiens]
MPSEDDNIPPELRKLVNLFKGNFPFEMELDKLVGWPSDHRHGPDQAASVPVVGKDDNDWPTPEQELEDRLDRFRLAGCGSRSEQQLAWSTFAEQSAYSPIRLDRDLGWRPTPNDLPSHTHPAEFGWTDAFEDLLTVSSARPMLSLERRSTLNRALQQLNFINPFLALAGGRPYSLLYSRAVLQGIDEAYFPLYIPQVRHRSPRSMEEWVTLRKVHPTTMADHWLKTSELIDGVVRDFESEQWNGNKDGEETEEDMYSFLKSVGEKPSPGPLTSLFRIVGKAVFGDDETTGKQEHGRIWGSREQVEEEVLDQAEYKTEDGGTETVTKTIQEAPGGGKLSAIRIERKDKLGRAISSEVHSSNRPDHFDSPFWKKFWENAQAKAQSSDVTKPRDWEESK